MISCVVLNYNGIELLSKCLKSLPPCNAIVVDNGSTDGSQDMVRERFPLARLISRSDNIGMAAYNEGIERALSDGADFVFLANNDVEFEDSSTFDSLVSRFEQDVGIVAPRQRLSDELIVKGGGKVRTWRLTTYEPEGEELDYAWNCMVKAEVFRKTGLIEPGYFIYWEDVDFGAKVRKAGYRVIDAPEVTIRHAGSSTSEKIRGMKGYLRMRNKLLYSRRNHSPARRAYDLGATTAELPFQLWSRLSFEDARLTLDGYFDGVRLMFGMEAGSWNTRRFGTNNRGTK